MTWDDDVARMDFKRVRRKFSAKNIRESDNLEDVLIFWRVMDGRSWTGFIWLNKNDIITIY